MSARFDSWSVPFLAALAAGEAPLEVLRRAAASAPEAAWPGRLWESHLDRAGGRSRQGAWFTPEPEAAAFVRRALSYCGGGRPLRVLDPACGAGNFLAPLAGMAGIEIAGIDIDAAALELARLRLGGVRLTCADTLELPPEPLYDLIVGNPPYLALPALPPSRRQLLRRKFATARGRFNTYALFLEWSRASLAPGGVGALLVPRRLWLNVGDAAVREWLSTRCRVLEVIELEYGLFKDAVVDSSLVIFRREGPSDRVLHRVARCREELEDAAGELVDFGEIGLAATPLFRKIAGRSRPFGDIAEIRDGIIQSRVGRELFQPERERPSDRPLLFGRDIAPGEIRYAGRRVDYRKEAMWALERSRGGSGLRLRDPAIFETPKLLTRQTGDAIVAAWDREGRYYYANTLHGARITDDEFSGEYLERYLNSPAARYCYRILAAETGQAFAQVKIAKLRLLPVPVLSPEARARVAAASRNDWRELYRALDLSFSEIKTLED